MTDGEIVKLARMIDRHREAMTDLMQRIEDSDHPNATEIVEDLKHQVVSPAWATHIIRSHLRHPEQWECDWYGIRAVSRRKGKK